MFGLGRQYAVYFSFPKSVFISLPKKKTSLCFYVIYVHLGGAM